MARLRQKPLYDLNESDKLVLFLYRMTDLTNSTFYREFNWTPSPDEVNQIDIADEERLIAFLVMFRHFYSSNEPTEIGKIRNAIKLGATKLQDKATLSELERIKESFKTANTARLVVHAKDGTPLKHIKSPEILDLYLNSRYFHTDVKGLPLFFQCSRKDLATGLRALVLCLIPYVQQLKAYVPLAVRVLSAKALPEGAAKTGRHFAPEAFAGAQQHDTNLGDRRGIPINLPSDLLPDELRSVLQNKINRDNELNFAIKSPRGKL